jgi:hypothetical protein
MSRLAATTTAPRRKAPPPEPDQLRPRVFLIGLVALAVFGLAVLAAEWAHQAWARHLGPRGELPAQLGSPTINELYQRQFPLERDEAERRAAQERRLHGYGWVDRDRGVIHVPVERAMEDLVRESEGRGGSGR